MGIRLFLLLMICTALVTHPFAATIKVSDGSVLVGEIIDRAEGIYTIRMRSGAEVRLRDCNIVAIKGADGSDSETLTIPNASLRFAGSNTVGERLLPAVAKAFSMSLGASDASWESSKENERTLMVNGVSGCIPKEIHVKAHGSSTAFSAFASGDADIGMSSRPIKPSEMSELGNLGDLTSPASEHILALDGVAIVVHPSNPLTTLTTQQIASIFSGQIIDWSDVGGQPASVSIYAREENSGTYDTFNSLVLRPLGLTLASNAKRVESSTELADSVAGDPTGIGFVGVAYVRNTKPLAINECGLHYLPETFAIKTEEYPLARRLFLYTPQLSPSPISEQFVDFALSPNGQEIVKTVGFVELSVESDSLGGISKTQVARMKSGVVNLQNVQTLQDFITTVEGSTRLSTTFRFIPGSARLDNRGLRDIERLTEYMTTGNGKGKHLMLLGFADSQGSYSKNLALSEARAQAVATQLAWSGFRGAEVKGFGEEAPVACNDNPTGLNKNRRVEVWVR